MKRLLVLFVAMSMLAIGASALFEKVNTYNGNFADVADTAWYAENVKTAYELGFMNGKAEGKFDPNGTVTVAEAVTMASRVHAIYNGENIDDYKKPDKSYGFDFDDENAPVTYNRATGKVEDGVLVVQSDKPNASGTYDPQVSFNKLNFFATDYNKLKVRMRIDPLPNTTETRKEVLQFYFMTSASTGITADKCIKVKLKDVSEDLTQWFEFEVDLFGHEKWTDIVTGFRFDPSDDNGIFYIDYIKFEKSENAGDIKWYTKYVDYAVGNGLYDADTFASADYNRNATRAEVCDLFAAALPEEYFSKINDINGIPDIMRDEKNADVYLMLYNAGVLLGSDSNGTFNPKSAIKRSEISAIINRVALPENRVNGSISADWSKQGNEYDLEFNGETCPENVVIGDAESFEVKNGMLVLKPRDRGAEKKPQFDPKITVNDIVVDSDEFTKLKVRMKVDLIDPVTSTKFDFYFATEEDGTFDEKKAVHQDFREFSYIDPAGWYVMEIDLSTHDRWKGDITSFRFDPANTNGVYTLDYIRLVKGDPLTGASHEKLLAEGYTATRLMQDEDFERGFFISHYEKQGDHTYGKWQDYCETDADPLWAILPIWNTYDLVQHRDTSTDKYTLKDDKGINTIIYNPEEKSVSMRLDATRIYEGKPHDPENYTWWPHLLLEQKSNWCSFDKQRNTAAADRMFIELDAKITDFKPTTNTEGQNVCDFLIYFYLQTDKAPGEKIWFGMSVFRGADLNMPVRKTGWSPDSAANQYMYGIRGNTVYDGMENSFNYAVGKVLMNEWKHVRLDVTQHLKTAVEWANRDNIFGIPVTVEDMYISGVNIGYEVRGNFDCTVEFKNFNMISYNK